MAASCRAVLPNYEETGMVLPFEHHFLPIHFNFAIKDKQIHNQTNQAKKKRKNNKKKKLRDRARFFTILADTYPGAPSILHVNTICKYTQPIALRYKTLR